MRSIKRLGIVGGILAVLAAAVSATGQTTQPSSAPATAPAASPPPASAPAAALDPTAEKILTRLEARDVRDLRAAVVWKLSYVIEDDDADVKSGRIWYKQSEPVAKFLVQFNKKIVDGRDRELDEKHLFDGCWYIELQNATKTLTRREVRRPDDRANPYKLGEGAFPLPFGQKKADILREFEVSVVLSGKGDPPDTDRLRLIPRPGTNTGRIYAKVDFWVAREGKNAGLPIKVAADKRDGTGKVNSIITVEFSDAQLNEGFSESIFKIDKPAGYEEIVEPLESLDGPQGAETPK